MSHPPRPRTNAPRLKIRATSARPSDWRVWIDDHEITTGLTGVTVEIAADDISRATLSMFVDDLDIDADTLMVLQAHVAGKAS